MDLYKRQKQLEKVLEPIARWGQPFPIERADELTAKDVHVYLQHHQKDFFESYWWPRGDGNWLVVTPCRGQWEAVRYFTVFACKHIWIELPSPWDCYHIYRCKKYD